MQEEMSAIQPKLVEASKEVDSSMAYVDKEQTEVSDLEKVVKGKFKDIFIYDLHQRFCSSYFKSKFIMICLTLFCRRRHFS